MLILSCSPENTAGQLDRKGERMRGGHKSSNARKYGARGREIINNLKSFEEVPSRRRRRRRSKKMQLRIAHRKCLPVRATCWGAATRAKLPEAACSQCGLIGPTCFFGVINFMILLNCKSFLWVH